MTPLTKKQEINVAIEENYQMRASRDQSGLAKHRQLGCLRHQKSRSVGASAVAGRRDGERRADDA